MGRGKSRHNVELIDASYDILSTIQPATVRAVCYQLFNRKLIASMAKNSTNKVSTQLRDARERGLIPWGWIVDETRQAERVSAWRDPAAYVDVVKRAYRRDRWADQPERVEVWSEKGTIRGTLAPVLDTFGVTLRVLHGYGSATTVYEAAQDSISDSRPLIVLYVGDWDPSGLHMSEMDLPQRLARYGGEVQIERVALTADHCHELGAAPAFAAASKAGDPRFNWYRSRYRRLCWELDALNPVVLREAVEGAIVAHIDLDRWERATIAEQAECESIRSILDTWPGISRQAQKCAEERQR